MRLLNKDKIFLFHIAKAIKRISSTVSKAKKGRVDQQDATDILVRQLTIIGEACNNLSPKFKKEYQRTIPFKDVVGMRNFVTHEYFNVDNKRVWDTSTKNIPELEKTILKILKKPLTKNN